MTEREEWLAAQLDWADRLMAVLMARPHPPLWARFDTSDTANPHELELKLAAAREALVDIRDNRWSGGRSTREVASDVLELIDAR